MPSNIRSDKRLQRGFFNLKTLSAAVASALVFSNAYAAGLGKLTVLSALGQPLRAEIELTSVSKDELGALTAKLASPEAYRQASIDFNPALMTLRFAIEQRGDRQFIRMSSSQPLNEPFVDMLLELSGPNGRLVREFTFLLDPADLRTAQPAQVAPAPMADAAPIPARAAPPARQAPQAEAPVAASATPTGRPQRAEVPAGRVTPQSPEQKANVASGDYLVQNGDTLARIAGRVKSSGVSLDQMLVALYQSNPDAFIGNNMNRLKAGQILSVPNADAARAVDAAEARGIVVAQAADFNNYRNKLAGQVAAGASQRSTEGRQTAGGRITAQVDEKPTPASESRDKLKLSSPQAAGGPNTVKAGPGSPTAEDRIARDKELAEANSRVRELEKNVTELQKLLEIKNKALAEQQKQAGAAKVETPAPAAAPATEQPKLAEAATEKPAEAKPAETPAAPAAAVPPADKPKAVAPPPPPAPEPSFVDELLGNPMILPGIGALLVALGALGIYRARRQKQGKQFEDSILTDSSLKANSLFGSTGGQSVDTNNSVFNSSFTPSASQLDTNEVDPVAEADVYIAYGRDAQAEEILKEALRTQPERHAVRLKLLEIYSNRKDLRAFEVLATELYGMTKGEGDEWAQAATMGAVLDPDNPLYASGRKEAVAADMQAPTQPLEEQGFTTLLADTQTDTAPLEPIDGLDADTAYFADSDLTEEPSDKARPQAEAEPEHKVTSADLDFDLDGMQELSAPNTIPRPAPAEPTPDLSAIDFDFLDEPVKPTGPAEPEAEAAPEPAFEPMADMASEPEPQQEAAAPIPTLDDLEFSLEGDKPSEVTPADSLLADIALEAPAQPEDEPSQEAQAAESAPGPAGAAADPFDFDLSDISLELDRLGGASGGNEATPDVVPEPVETPLPSEPTDLDEESAAPAAAAEATELPDLDFDAMSTEMLTEDPDINAAEMATKLDLAIAYQEIGDKEGARELLDEVLKGGTPEQSERAKALLLELA